MDNHQPYLEPWTWILDEEEGKSSSDALAEEVGPEHPLHGIATRGIVSSILHDDTLYELLDGSGRVAFVHLTYGGRQSGDWPLSKMYDSLEHWQREQMPEDHDEWLYVHFGRRHATISEGKLGENGRQIVASLRRELQAQDLGNLASKVGGDVEFTVGGDPKYGYRLWGSVGGFLDTLGRHDTEAEALEDARTRFGVRTSDWAWEPDAESGGGTEGDGAS